MHFISSQSLDFEFLRLKSFWRENSNLKQDFQETKAKTHFEGCKFCNWLQNPPTHFYSTILVSFYSKYYLPKKDHLKFLTRFALVLSHFSLICSNDVFPNILRVSPSRTNFCVAHCHSCFFYDFSHVRSKAFFFPSK